MRISDWSSDVCSSDLASSLAYWAAGSWRTHGLIALAQRDPAAAQQQMIDGMVAKLTAHLRDEPDDAQGWAMLGRSYVVLQRFTDATKASRRANALYVAQQQADDGKRGGGGKGGSIRGDLGGRREI